MLKHWVFLCGCYIIYNTVQKLLKPCPSHLSSLCSYLILSWLFFSRGLILFQGAQEHTKHQSTENLHFGFCYHAFPSITYSESLWALPKMCPQNAFWQGIYCIRLYFLLSFPRNISRFNVIGLKGNVTKCTLENFEELNFYRLLKLVFLFYISVNM